MKYKHHRKLVLRLAALALVLIACGCELFTTRDPESPSSNQSTFQQPVSEDIVVSNFYGSINEKNVDNYIACLTPAKQADSANYSFSPEAKARATYTSIFDNWSLESERRWFVSLISNLSKETPLKLNLFNSRFESKSPDSCLFVSDYTLVAQHSISSVPKEFSGTLMFTIAHDNSGLWYIRRWIDVGISDDSIPSWSILKASFYL